MKSFEKYCTEPENIENYEAAKKNNFKGWEVHHRLETHNSDGERRLVDITKDELKALDMYYHRPASELIFLTTSEHNTLHHKGKLISEETKKKLSEAKKGHLVTEETRKKLSEAKKGKHLSEETRKKMSAAKKGKHLSEETRNKMSESRKGKHLSEETRKKLSESRKGKHLSEETRNKMREAHKGNTNTKGKYWYNNGKINIRAKECPPGFVPGMLR